ncbi:transposase IS116/IS110/IS902 family protein [Paenibacillus alvei A6-6i-x]|nr:transposase IS116/IS110/IS902 family protein [Paenibacillus alvei A6-6i-x]
MRQNKILSNKDALAKEIEEYDLIRSIPGIGDKIAATLLSEIGEVDRFDHPKKGFLHQLVELKMMLGIHLRNEEKL